MLSEFVKLIDSDDEIVDVKELFNVRDKRKWQKWIDIFESIRIDNVASGVKEVSKTYKLNKTEEVTVLAYVKFLELMINSVGRMEEETKKGIGERAVSPVNDRMYG